jgi:hypothetical protein
MANLMVWMAMTVTLVSLICPPAAGLDFNQEVQKQDTEAAQILSTLTKPVNTVSAKGTNKVKVVLVAKKAVSK